MIKISNEFQTQSILQNKNFYKFVSKSLLPKFLTNLLSFYYFTPNLFTKINYHKITKAIAILKVLESLLKKIQSGKLSIKNANKMIKKHSNIFLSEINLIDEIKSGPNQPKDQMNFATLQMDFLNIIGIDLKDRGSQIFQIRDLKDISLAMGLVRMLDWLLDMRNFVSSGLDWDSDFMKNRFEGINELSIQNDERQFVQDLFKNSSFDLKLNFSSEMLIFSVENPFYNERFFSFRKLKR